MSEQTGEPVGSWLIEYEIPPLRAIYHAQADDCTEVEAIQSVRINEPRWKIRKITPIENIPQPQ